MSKVAFSKLGLKKVENINTIVINGVDIEVKQYLPIAEKLNLIQNVLNNSADDNNFANPVKVDILSHLEIIYAYTNLTFTDKQKGDPAKLYDLLDTNGVITSVIAAMDELEYNHLIQDISDTIDSYYKYKNSALGIMEVIGSDYSNLELDATKLQSLMADPKSLELLKGIMTKLG